MTKRFFLALALTGVLGFAFASPAQASIVTVDTGFVVVGGTATDLEITFTLTGGSVGPITPIAAGGLSGLTYGTVGDTVTLTFAASAGTTPAFTALPVEFSFTTDATAVTIATVSVTGSTGSAAFGGGRVAIGTVPEPASLALLGIGMTGFLAFRRYFKKTSVA
jgi:hypothetical protein